MGRKSRAKQLKDRSPVSSTPAPRLAPRRPSRRRIWYAALLGFGAVGVLVAGYAYLHATAPVSVSAILSSSGNAQFVYGTSQQETYSPACGCMADKSERWRGITFAARRVRISNTTETAQTAFWLMAAYPSALDWSPTLFRHRVRVLRLSVRDERALGAEDIARAAQIENITVLEDKSLSEWDAAALVTNQPVIAILPGKYPIAAYIPVDNSRVSITQRESTFPGRQSPPVIREDYPASSVQVGHVGDIITGGDLLAYPMIDLVGPETIFITEDPAAVLIARDYSGQVNGQRLREARSVTAIIVTSPFSTRVSAMPLGPITRDAKFEGPLPAPTRSQFREPDRPAHVVNMGAGPVDLPTDVVPRRRGVLELAILESLAPADYSHLERSLSESDTVRVQDTRSRVEELDRTAMSFRYPPIPPVGGFNVFGLLSQLDLHVQKGRIMLGSSAVSIDAPSVLEFSAIQAFTPWRNVVPIPLVVSGREQSLDFSLESTSKLSINRAFVRIEADRKRSMFEYAVTIAALIQGISAVVTIFWPRG